MPDQGENTTTTVTPTFGGFSDQVYRHRRNLLLFSTIIIACSLFQGSISNLPLGLEIAKNKDCIKLFILLIELYYLLIFSISSCAEYCLWPFKTYLQKRSLNSNSVVVADERYELHKMDLNIDEILVKITEDINRDYEPAEEDVSGLKNLLKAFKRHITLSQIFSTLRLIFDFWTPLLVSVIALICLYNLNHDILQISTQQLLLQEAP